MSFVLNLILANIFLLVLAGVALRYGRAGGTRLVDKWNGVLTKTIPSGCLRLVRRWFGEAAAKKLASIYKYVVHERNPLTMILYLVVSIGGYITFVLSGYPFLTEGYHKECGFVLFCASLWFFTKAAADDPGIITKANHAKQYEKYPFDGLVFKRDVVCRTCGFAQPARAKHCRYCDLHVSRFDHHCIWINQCVGGGNVKSFLMFLLSNNVMCLYGGYLGINILISITQDEDLSNVWFRDSVTGLRFQSTPYYIAVYISKKYMALTYVTIFALLMGLLLLAFTYYHWVVLLKDGLTSNEESKIADLPDNSRARFLETYSKRSWWANLVHIFTS